MPGPLGIGAGSGGTVTSVSGSAPISVANGTTTPAISVTAGTPGAVTGGATASAGTIANGVAAADHVHSTDNLGVLNVANTWGAKQAFGEFSTYGMEMTPSYGTILQNAYYDGAWKYRANGPAWGIGNNFGGTPIGAAIAVAATNAGGANAALTWQPVLNVTNQGCVGIGTSSPAEMLTLNAAAGASRLVRYEAAGTVKGYVGLGTDNVMRVMTTDGAQARIAINGGDVVYASTTGLGIFGQASNALSVTGNANISGSLTVGGSTVATTPNTFVLLGQTTLASAAATISVSSIPQTFRNLVIYLSNARMTGTLAYESAYFRLNGDASIAYQISSTNYTYLTSIVVPSGGSYLYATALFSTSISNYSNTSIYKMGGFSTGSYATNSLYTSTGYAAGVWKSFAAVTSVSATASTSTFGVGTTMSVYGYM